MRNYITRAEVAAFVEGVSFTCTQLVAAAKLIGEEQRGTVTTTFPDGSTRTTKGAITRSGNPTYAADLFTLAELLYAAAKDEVAKLYPDFEPPKTRILQKD